MSGRCQEIELLLSAYHDGELDAKDAERVRAHVADCAACSRVLEAYAVDDRVLASSAPRRSEAEWETLARRVDEAIDQREADDARAAAATGGADAPGGASAPWWSWVRRPGSLALGTLAVAALIAVLQPWSDLNPPGVSPSSAPTESRTPPSFSEDPRRIQEKEAGTLSIEADQFQDAGTPSVEADRVEAEAPASPSRAPTDESRARKTIRESKWAPDALKESGPARGERDNGSNEPIDENLRSLGYVGGAPAAEGGRSTAGDERILDDRTTARQEATLQTEDAPTTTQDATITEEDAAKSQDQYRVRHQSDSKSLYRGGSPDSPSGAAPKNDILSRAILDPQIAIRSDNPTLVLDTARALDEMHTRDKARRDLLESRARVWTQAARLKVPAACDTASVRIKEWRLRALTTAERWECTALSDSLWAICP